jgi:hypothetical protein
LRLSRHTRALRRTVETFQQCRAFARFQSKMGQLNFHSFSRLDHRYNFSEEESNPPFNALNASRVGRGPPFHILHMQRRWPRAEVIGLGIGNAAGFGLKAVTPEHEQARRPEALSSGKIIHQSVTQHKFCVFHDSFRGSYGSQKVCWFPSPGDILFGVFLAVPYL